MRSRIRTAAVVGLVAAAAVASLALVMRAVRPEEAGGPLNSLWNALGGVRPIEGRIAGGLVYARYQPPPPLPSFRGQSDKQSDRPWLQSVDFLRAAVEILEEHDRKPSVETARRMAA